MTGTRATEERLEMSEDLSRQLLGLNGDGGLDMLKSIPGLKVHVRGNLISLNGCPEGVKKAKKFMRMLDKRLADGVAPDGREMRFLFGEVIGVATDVSEEAFREIFLTHSGRSIRPKTFNQQSYIDALAAHDITVSIGPAGTGKTFLATAYAVRALKEKRVNRIILSRPTVEAGEKLGYLPGDLMEKVDPHFRPLYDALNEFLGISRFQQYLRQGIIEITPLGFMRGRTFNESFILVDEAQNTSILQMKMLLTRLGFGSKMVITGDQTQIDLPDPRSSSLHTLGKILNGIEGVAFVHLQHKDVVRHELVKRIIRAYEDFLTPGGSPGA
jgi:phosphate starvation-inducible PhoH-like protein